MRIEILYMFGVVIAVATWGYWYRFHEDSGKRWKVTLWWLGEWKHVQDAVKHHHRAFHRVHGLTHMGYFATVFFHGPYNMFAGCLLVLALVGWILHLEDQ